MTKTAAAILACLTLALAARAANATVWEGSADAGDMPGETYAIATNSFPRNTVVDVTNLENNRTVRVMVISGQDNSGLLATLSREAAEVIGISGDSVRRVRIAHPSDSVAFAHVRRGPLFDPGEIAEEEPEPARVDRPTAETRPPEIYEPTVPVSPAEGAPGESAAISNFPAAEPDYWASGETGYDGELPAWIVTETWPEDTPPYAPEASGTPGLAGGGNTAEPIAPPEPERTAPAPATTVPDLVFTLVPTSERLPPVLEHLIPPEYIIPPIDASRPIASAVPPARAESVPEPAAAPEAPPAPTESVPQPAVPSDFSPFDNVPLVSRLERDRWYVQLGTFARFESVEDEISRISAAHPYPLLIQNVGTDMDPMFHILLGPLNQGESAAVLRRVRSVGSTNAFVKVAD